MRLVVSVALRCRNRGLELDDLVQEGALGLIHAIDKFDPQRGCRLSTYAPWWVRQSIGKAIRERGRPVRLPGSAAAKLRLVECCRAGLVQRLGREPEPAELAKASGISLQTLESLRAATRPAVSLDDADHARLPCRGETIADPFAEAVEHITFGQTLRIELHRALAGLADHRQRYILERHYGLDSDEPETVREIGAELGVSGARVSQLETAALAGLSALPAARWWHAAIGA